MKLVLFTFLVLSILCLVPGTLAKHHISRSHHKLMNADGGDKKSLWEDVHNMEVEAAINKIKAERPELNVVKVSKDSMVTMDFRLDRVRVWYDPDTGKVEGAPKIG